MPGHSFFNEARANDEELAEHLAKLPEPERVERLSNWDPHLVMLAQIVDRLGTVVQAVVMSNGGAKPSVPPVRRPVTALQIFRKNIEREEHRALVERMTRR